jgi:hypothetical protein
VFRIDRSLVYTGEINKDFPYLGIYLKFGLNMYNDSDYSGFRLDRIHCIYIMV